MSDVMRPEDAPPGIYAPDGRPQFFQDPAMDRFVAVILNLTSELWVQTERVDTLKALIEAKGLATPQEISALIEREDAAREAALAQFVHRILGPLRESAA